MVQCCGDDQTFIWLASGDRAAHNRQGVNQTYRIWPNTHRVASVGPQNASGPARGLQFDAAGNLYNETRHDGYRGYGYDSFNRLGAINLNGTTASYLSHALNQRVAETVGGNTTRSVYGAGAGGCRVTTKPS